MLNALVINLKSRPDRLAHITEEMKKLPGVEYEIFEAVVDGTNTCYQSHYNCVKLAKERGWPEVLIIEDDLVLVGDFSLIFEESLKELKEREWSMFYGGANLQSEARRVSEHLAVLSGAYAAHFYIVNSSFYDEILSIPPGREMDVVYREKMRDFPCFVAVPMFAGQLPNFSNLQGRFRDYTEEMNWNFRQFLVDN